MTTTATKLVALSLTVIALVIPSVASAAPTPVVGTYHATEQTDQQPASPSVSGSDSGFSWSDAALGGAAVLAIVIAGAGAAVMVRSHRHGHAQVGAS